MKKSGQKYISIIAAVSLLGQFSAGLVAQSAIAADDLVDPIMETTEVEYGTGWYLRGHVSVTATENLFSSETSIPIPLTASQQVTETSTDNVFTYGVGMGYRFSENYRADIGFESLGTSSTSSRGTISTLRPPCSNGFIQVVQTDAFGNTILVLQPGHNITNCLSEDASSYSLSDFMANVYYDFDSTFYGLKPFVGLGLGIVRNEFTSTIGSTTCVAASFEQCNPTDGGVVTLGESYTQQGTRNNGTAYHLAGSFTAGLSYDMGDNLYLDTSYNFLGMIEDPIWGGNNGLAAAGAPSSFHSIKIGLRYEIW